MTTTCRICSIKTPYVRGRQQGIIPGAKIEDAKYGRICPECLNVLIKFYANNPYTENFKYLRIIMEELPREELDKLYPKAKDMNHYPYCQKIIELYERRFQNDDRRDETTKNRVSINITKNIIRTRGSTCTRHREKHTCRNQTEKRN